MVAAPRSVVVQVRGGDSIGRRRSRCVENLVLQLHTAQDQRRGHLRGPRTRFPRSTTSNAERI